MQMTNESTPNIWLR